MFNPSRFVSAALLGMAGALSLARPAAAQTGLQFNGSTQYVRSATPGLTASQFTVELWFRRDGTGTGASTGSGGLSGAFPLVAKGAAQAEDNVSDLNYFLGISSTNTLCADFEHFVAAGNSPNHPLTAATGTINVGTWYHGALTYDGPASSTNTYVAIATTLQTNGTSTAGFFNGAIDEVRIWNVARSQCDIIGSMTQELTSGSGLIARWGLNEGSGTTAVNSSGTPNGELRPTATPPLWVTPGSPFTDPIAPTGLAASAPNPNQGHLTWGDAGGESGYQVERSSTGPGSGFATLATLAANATSYEDFTVSPSTTYWYRVAGTGACNPSYSNVSSATTPLEPCNALSFNTGTTGGYVTFGAAPGLDASAFTVETWFMRTGAGAVTSTGAGGSSALGLTNVVPLVAKGRGEGDGGQIDCNYFLGIQNTPSVVLAADYEHDATSNNNHAIIGTTVLQNARST
ncbi:MAG: LamG domain-containing protein [Candidatus Eisenbacteria bacterium]|uniref:LamG domain-containing protein n=1 Tax=Eiseniibacteriota bacterium TaxID=2212470 RepID=A0A538TWE8_UNCEI|nr:MAG: LamG domain-containing protein [Candidatus Eisenbacteria bacterium]